jgi:hypothetical protein
MVLKRPTQRDKKKKKRKKEKKRKNAEKMVSTDSYKKQL